MVRKKKGKNVETRLQEIFDDHLFDRMKNVRPDFLKRIVAVEGDCLHPDLGLSLQDKELLMNEVREQ